MQAIELARKHGWEEADQRRRPPTSRSAGRRSGAGGSRGRVVARPGRRVLERDTQPTPAMMLTRHGGCWSGAWPPRGGGGGLSGCRADGGAACHAAHVPARVQALTLETLIRVGETERVERALAEMDEEVRETSQMRAVLAALRLARDDPEDAVEVLAPSSRTRPRPWRRGGNRGVAAGGDLARRAWRPGAASCAPRARARGRRARRAAASVPALLAAELLQRQARLRTTHASLIAEILHLPSGRTPAARARGRCAAPGTPLRQRAARAALPADPPPGAGKSRPSCSCR